MEVFALYLLKSAIWLTGFSLVYFLFLKNERFFLLKRIYLITGILISFIFPLVTIHYQVELPGPVTDTSDIVQASPDLVNKIQHASPEMTFNYKYILLSLYLTGIIFLAFKLIKHIVVLLKTIRKTGTGKSDRTNVIRASEITGSFSFFNYVFINPSLNETELEMIMNHELVHVNQKHWFDLLLVELIRLFQWVNPFAWIYTGFIRQNHEFIADEVALQQTPDPAVYKAVLVNQLLGTKVISLSNSFNYSVNKKRFDMMKKIVTSPYRKMKLLLVLPVFAIIFYAFATPEYNYISPKDNIVNGSQFPLILIKEVKGAVVNEVGNPFPGVTVVVSGISMGSITDAAGNFFLTKVPDDASLVFSFEGYKTQIIKPDFSSAMKVKMVKDPDYKKNIVVRTSDGSEVKVLVVVDGVVSGTGIGNIDRATILSMGVLKDKEATDKYGEKGKDGVIEITTKKTTSPSATDKPAGEAVAGHADQQKPNPLVVIDGVISQKNISEVIKELGYNRGIMKLTASKEAMDKYGDKGANGVYELTTRQKALEMGLKPSYPRLAPEDYPTFQDKKWTYFNEWVTNQVKYPSDAQTRKLEGWVTANFTIEPDGSISNVVSASSVDPVLRDEVIRVIKASPKWEPPKNADVDEPFTSSVNIGFELPDQIKKEVPFVVVEQMPQYPGEEGELLKFIATHTKYPEEAIAKKIQGKVIIRFIVNTDGYAEGLSVLKGIDPLLDNEALRVVSMLSGFRPGMQGGKAVNVWYMVPVNFSLAENYKL